MGNYAVTAGYTLSANNSAPGIKNVWINQGDFSGRTIDSSTNQITAFTGATDDDAWYKFELALGEGQLARATTVGSGGKEHVHTLTMKIGGWSQAKADTLDQILDSSRLQVVVEGYDDTLWYISRTGMTATASAFDTGTSGGGATSIGETITLTSNDFYDKQQVNLGSNANLDAITS